jgi:flagellar hook-basal body complex protein FliE
MTVNAANAVAAYGNTVRAAVPTGEARPQPGQTFANLVENAADAALQAGHSAERMSTKAVAGSADLSEVVTAVANAEVTLQTVVAVRDRVVQAYQEIMRMPI